MTRTENLKNCIDSLIEVTKDLEPIAVEHRRVAKVVTASTVGLSERQLAEQLAMSRSNTITFAVKFRLVEQLIRLIGADLPECKATRFEEDIRALKSELVCNFDSVNWNLTTITRFRMLISDFYANWSIHFFLLDVANPAKPPSGVRAEVEDLPDSTQQTDGQQTTGDTLAIAPPDGRFRRHGQTINVSGEDIELSKQQADLLEGLLKHPDGWLFDDLRKSLSLDDTQDSGIHSRISHLRRKIEKATQKCKFSVDIKVRSRTITCVIKEKQ